MEERLGHGRVGLVPLRIQDQGLGHTVRLELRTAYYQASDHSQGVKRNRFFVN